MDGSRTQSCSPRICMLLRVSAAGEAINGKKGVQDPTVLPKRREPVLGAVFREAIRRHVTFLALLLRDGDGMGWDGTGWDGTQPVGHCLKYGTGLLLALLWTVPRCRPPQLVHK